MSEVTRLGSQLLNWTVVDVTVQAAPKHPSRTGWQGMHHACQEVLSAVVASQCGQTVGG